MQNYVQLIGLQNAVQTSFNHATGAYVSDAPTYVQLQLNAANEFIASEQQGISNIAKDLNSLSTWFPNVAITVANVAALQQQLDSQGFSASEISLLEGLGLDSSDITGLLSLMGSVDPLDVAGIYPQNFSSLASALVGK
jgi:hypothetical protein